MSTFGRTFAIDLINDRVLAENPWFKDLLLFWRPAGDARHRDMAEAHKLGSNDHSQEEDPQRLRLAIRHRYLNFYRGGQSIAEVHVGPKAGLRTHIHNKYVYGNKDGNQDYVTLTSAGYPHQENGPLRKYGGASELRRWISNASANAHESIGKGKEKRFIDLVVARNPDTIDLEMALPAFLLDPKERKAPRIDLVALEPAGDRWRIVFWEAKLVDDGRARCRGNDVCPRVVVDQLEPYKRWLRHANHRELVACAYQNACRLLVGFRRLAMSVNTGIEELGPGIIAAAAADAPPLLVDDEPRLLIDDRSKDVAFTQHGHLSKLRDNCGVRVQMVSGFGDMVLESGLPPVSISQEELHPDCCDREVHR